MRLGLHIRVAKGLPDGLKQAEWLGCETVQFFSSNPNSWKLGNLDPERSDEYVRLAEKLNIHPTTLHTPYLLNLASPKQDNWNFTINLLKFALQRAEMLKAKYVVTHIGSYKDTTYEHGVERICAALERTLTEVESSAMILLEAGSGAGNSIGSKFSELRDIFAGLRPGLPDIGVTLDTAHLWGAGYDISTKDNVDAVLASFDESVGLHRLKLLHLNDSRQLLDSKVDRHWHIGEGNIGIEGFRAIINHPALTDLPGVAETPGRELEEDARNLVRLKELRIQPT